VVAASAVVAMFLTVDHMPLQSITVIINVSVLPQQHLAQLQSTTTASSVVLASQTSAQPVAAIAAGSKPHSFCWPRTHSTHTHSHAIKRLTRTALSWNLN
jgi:hypothetical protein